MDRLFTGNDSLAVEFGAAPPIECTRGDVARDGAPGGDKALAR